MSNPRDIFISHASEDKERFVRPLATALRAHGVDVWYDEWELDVGDSLVEKINDGLAASRFGVVVLSPAFFQKNWPKAELQALAALEMRSGRNLLLPVWLDVGADEISSHAPLLLGRVALLAADGAETVAGKLARKVQAGTGTILGKAVPPEARTLYPSELRAQALNSYSAPLAGDEIGFVFRTAIALSMPVGPAQHLDSQQKRGFQAIVSDSKLDGLVRDLAGVSPPDSAGWNQVQPNTGTLATIGRAPETMAGRGGTVEARSGLLLRSYPGSTGYGIVHVDVILRPPAEMKVNSLLSLDDFYDLLRIPSASLRDEIAPVVTALLAGSDEPALQAQTLVAIPYNDTFHRYLDLSTWAQDRAQNATDPSAVHWEATSTSDFMTDPAWETTVIRMIDRLFSDGGFLDYEHAIDRLKKASMSS